MKFDQEILEEMNLLSCYELDSLQTGIKIHSDAGAEKIQAAQRLFDKGLLSQNDGGYLTERGHTAVEHLQHLLGVLK